MAQNEPNFRVKGDEQFVDPKKLNRNVTPVHQEIAKILFSPIGVAGFVAVTAITSVFFPVTLPFDLLASVVVMGVTMTLPTIRRQTLPLRLPLEEGDRIDYNAPAPQHRKYNKAQGAYLLGNTWGAMREVWAAYSDLLTHCLVIGGTGAGKSEQLLSMVYNGLSLGGGSVYVDPKGGSKLYGQHWTMLRLLGRDDDMRVLNLSLGTDELGKSPLIRSNTLQPFAFGKASSLKEIPLSLMAGGGKGGDGNSVFAANGKTLITSLMMGLVDLRDMGEIPLSINNIRDYIQPNAFIELAQRKDISKDAREAMISFMTSLGWKPDEKDRSKWGDFDRQYSYAQNYFLEILSTVSDTYRHIFNVPIGDIHMPDVIFQRRCFVAIIPALEKSKAELSTLGKITLMILRLGVASGLGDGGIMGNWRKLVDLSLSASRVPSFFYIDEYAAIAVEGFAEVFTQGRGLGISATVGSQDWAGVKKANEAEAQQIVANTKFKFIMTTDDPNDTKQLIESLSGDAMEMQAQSFAVQGLVNYYDTQSATAQRTKRTDQKDFAAQVEGEWHLFFKDKIIRGFGFFAGGVPDDRDAPLFVHHMLMVEKPSRIAMSIRFGNLKETMQTWKNKVAEQTTLPPYPSDDYTGYEGYRPLGEVFMWPLEFPEKAGHLREKRRRELACAAVYKWMESDPFAIPRNRTEKIRPTLSAQTPVPEQEGSVTVEKRPEKRAESAPVNSGVEIAPRQRDLGAHEEANQKPGAPLSEDLKQQPAESAGVPNLQGIDAEGDPLAALEMMMGNETHEGPEGPPAGDEEFHHRSADSHDISNGEAPSVTEGSATESMDLPGGATSAADSGMPGATEVMDGDIPEFAALTQALAGDMESRVDRHARVLQDSAIAMGASPGSPEVAAIPRQVVDRIKSSMSNPPYPTPPKPEKRTASDVRPIAERWVQRIKGS